VSSAAAALRAPYRATEAGERDAAARVEHNAFALEQLALDRLEARLRARTDLAARVDDAVPWHGAPDRQGVQRVADLARAPGQARRRGDLSVGGDASARDAGDRRVDAFVGRIHSR